MLLYAYYTSLTPVDTALFEKCHSYHNELFNDILEILTEKLEHIYGFPYLRMVTFSNFPFTSSKWSKPIYYWSGSI